MAIQDLGTLDSLRITALIEDYAGYETELLGQHGVSFLARAESGGVTKRILFDAGQAAAPILENMKKLYVDPGSVDMVFLSHCHYDHTGGVVGLLEAVGKEGIPVLAHPEIFRPHFVADPYLRDVGMPGGNPQLAIRKAGGNPVLCRDAMKLMDGIVSTGEIQEKEPFEEEPTISLFTLEEGRRVPDPLRDDMSLVFALPDGIVVLSGCSHAGIVSIVKTARDLAGTGAVRAVIGGFHLVDADEARIRKTAEALVELDVGAVCTGHCTGLKAEAELLRRFGDRFMKLHSGWSMSF